MPIFCKVKLSHSDFLLQFLFFLKGHFFSTSTRSVIEVILQHYVSFLSVRETETAAVSMSEYANELI